MKLPREILDIMHGAIGTTAYHRFAASPIFPVVTDGVIALAQAAECFWLLDRIGSHQINPKLDKDFQVWKLSVDMTNHSAVLRGFNDTTLIVKEKLSFTTFPLSEVTFYLMDGVLLLPSEH